MASGSDNNELIPPPGQPSDGDHPRRIPFVGVLRGIDYKVIFVPTDLELLKCYLVPKASGTSCPATEFLPEFDVYSKEPWKLGKFRLQRHGKDARKRHVRYYFCHKRHHDCDGSEHRVRHFVGEGFWECGLHDVKVMDESGSCVGWKNYYVFKLTDKGDETGWIMVEYVLNSSTPEDQKWMVCKIYERKRRERKSPRSSLGAGTDNGCGPQRSGGNN